MALPSIIPLSLKLSDRQINLLNFVFQKQSLLQQTEIEKEKLLHD